MNSFNSFSVVEWYFWFWTFGSGCIVAYWALAGIFFVCPILSLPKLVAEHHHCVWILLCLIPIYSKWTSCLVSMPFLEQIPRRSWWPFPGVEDWYHIRKGIEPGCMQRSSHLVSESEIEQVWRWCRSGGRWWCHHVDGIELVRPRTKTHTTNNGTGQGGFWTTSRCSGPSWRRKWHWRTYK